MIVFVGSNPSAAAKNLAPFTEGTKSGQVLKTWLAMADIKYCAQHNVSNKPTPNNRPLTVSEIKECLPGLIESLQGYTKVVALGKTAHLALQMAGIRHLEMDHPSGMNRKLNDTLYVEKLIEKLKDYAQG